MKKDEKFTELEDKRWPPPATSTPIEKREKPTSLKENGEEAVRTANERKI